MAKIFKYSLYTLLTIVVLAIIGIVVLLSTFNPNNLKGAIAQQVKAATGHELTISGNISWKFFPWVGLSIQGINVANAAGFDQNKSFLKLNEVDADVKLFPLLRGNIEIGKIKLDGLQINLATNEKNQNNWSNLVNSQTDSTKASTATKTTTTKNTSSNSRFKLGAFKISAIDISNASISYANLKTKQNYILKNFNLSSEDISLDSAFPITMNFSFNSTNPNLNGQVDLNTRVALNQTTQSITISPLVFNAQVNGAKLPKEGVNINLETNLTLNKTDGTLNIDKLIGKIANLQFDGKVAGVDIFNNPTFNVSINIAAFNPQALLNALGITPPNFANKNAMTNLGLNSQFIYTPTAVSITSLQLALDQSKITGTAYLALSNKDQSKFDLNINKINLSDYTIANNNSAASQSAAINLSTPTQPAASTPLLPVNQLRQLNLVGNVVIGTLNFNKFQMNDVKLNINANNGIIEMKDNQANLYEGQWQSNIGLNVQTDTPTLQVNEVVNNVQVAKLINAFYNSTKYQVTGTGDIKLSVTTTGNSQNAFIKNMNGDGQFSLNNGVIQGINLSYQMNTALALVNKQTPPSQPTNSQTPFGSLTGTIQINNGVISNNDLLLQSPALKVSGKGNVNLVNKEIQYQVESSAIEGQINPSIYALQQKIGGSIPIKISGTCSHLKIYPDVEVILANMATTYVKQNTDKIKQAVNSQVQKLTGKLQQGLQDSLNNLLR